ncbi:hypothetical protein C0V73_22750 [Rhizobium sp. TH135]|uniref:hypothetical protein n=1 Tax=Rhizobium sp. TH135 TaxID=2067451 RepID=UPI000C7A09F3|nr:hypothetical protein [Rhizobium sp. TH135]PLK68692.1 hypothetical protein C0V73_22750 [Rhizobium sp. TH135]
MSKLAAEYGISGNGLAKVCDRLNVPYPPRGYWAKKAAGKPVVTLRLPKQKDGAPTSTVIWRPPTPAPPPVLSPEVEQKIAKLTATKDTLVVSDRLLRPHKIIQKWLDDRDERRKTAKRQADPRLREIMDPGEWTPVERRIHRLCDALIKALERQGGKVQENQRRELEVTFGDISIEFQLREKLKQVRRPLTKDEMRYRSAGERGWRQELEPTGLLVFAFKTWLPAGFKQERLEPEPGAMEGMLQEILISFLTIAPLLQERKRQDQEDARQCMIAEHQRFEERQRQKADAKRWQTFMDMAETVRRVEEAKRFGEMLRAMPFDPDEVVEGRTVSDWLAWVDEHLQTADPRAGGVAAVFARIGRTNEWSP